MDPLLSPSSQPPDVPEVHWCGQCSANLFEDGEHEPWCPQVVPEMYVADPYDDRDLFRDPDSPHYNYGA